MDGKREAPYGGKGTEGASGPDADAVQAAVRAGPPGGLGGSHKLLA